MAVKQRYPAQSSGSASGYTLLEALIALTIFMIAVVPLTMRIMTVPGASRVARQVIATCILEQEAAALRLAPHKTPVRKKRMVGGREWEVRFDYAGEKLKMCKVAVVMEKKVVAEAQLYLFMDK